MMLCFNFVEMGDKAILHFDNVMQCYVCNLFGLVNILFFFLDMFCCCVVLVI